MTIREIALTGALALGLAVPAAAQGAGSTATTGKAVQPTSAVEKPSPSQESAAVALQDARRTLSRLAEASMSRDVRADYDRLSTNFRALYKAYTGHEMTEQDAASAAVAPVRHSAWKASYDAVADNLSAMIGPATSAGHETPTPAATAGSGHPNATGTTGQVPKLMSEMTQPVRDDLLTLRGQLQRFERAADGYGSTTARH